MDPPRWPPGLEGLLYDLLLYGATVYRLVSIIPRHHFLYSKQEILHSFSSIYAAYSTDGARMTGCLADGAEVCILLPNIRRPVYLHLLTLLSAFFMEFENSGHGQKEEMERGDIV